MSRCVNLNQALANASSKRAGLSMKRFEIFSYAGSNRSERSVVSIVGKCFLEASNASGMIAAPSFATHWFAPAGLFVSTHSLLKRILKKEWLHCLGVGVHVTSSPEVIASVPLPDLKSLFHPNPCSSRPAASGSLPTWEAGPAPCVLPNECPPAIRATVSSSFIPIRPNVSRISLAAASGSGLPFGPSGLT